MFRKPFKIKSNTQVKGSERKKIRSELGSHFPLLTDEDLLVLFPNKEYISTMKILTHCEESVVVFLVNKVPLAFEIKKVMYPTVYTLWRFPNLVHTFTTHPFVFSKLIGGADLMLPGVVMEEPFTLKSFGKLEKGDIVAVNLTDNRAPIAVGTAALSSFDMYMSAKRGKGVHILHFHGDLLSGSVKLNPPNLGPPSIITSSESETNRNEIVEIVSSEVSDFRTEDSVGLECKGSSLESDDSNKLVEENPETGNAECFYDSQSAKLSIEESGLGKHNLDYEEIEHDDITSCVNFESAHTLNQKFNVMNCDNSCEEANGSMQSVQDSMDKLIEYCFQKALKKTARKLTLPLLTSNFFKVHMIPACPKGEALDLKKSSYKKLSKFLKEMEARKVIEIRELTKGVESIVSVDFNHPLLKHFVEDSEDEEDSSIDTDSGKAAEISEMFVINSSTLPIFKNFGYRKGDSLLATSIRQHLTDYVARHGLQSSDDKRFVKLDHTLSSCLRIKEVEELSWKELMVSCVEQMGNSYSLGQTGLVNKGKLKPIEITVATRTGNKKVTLINNLELYGINCIDFAKKCQHGVAASAGVNQIPGTKSAQVMVQGNQVLFLEKLLTGEYQIQKRFIRGLENAPKLKKQKKAVR